MKTALIEISQQVLRNTRGTYTTSSHCIQIRTDIDAASLEMQLMIRDLSWTDGYCRSITSLIKEVTEDMDRYDHMKIRERDYRISSTRICPTGISEEQEEDSRRRR